MDGIGLIDPDLARDLAAAAARSARSTWYVTVTDDQGHAIRHGCARPEPARHASHAKRAKPGTGTEPDPPGPPDDGPPRFTFTPAGPGPPGGYGTWRLSIGIAGQPDLLVTLDPIPDGQCDHRYAAKGHDPGVKLTRTSVLDNSAFMVAVLE